MSLLNLLFFFITHQFIDIGQVAYFLFNHYTNLHDCDIEVYVKKSIWSSKDMIVGIRLTFMYGTRGIKTINMGHTEFELNKTPHFVVTLGFNAFFNSFGLVVGSTYRRIFSVTNGMKKLVLDITDKGVVYVCRDSQLPNSAFERLSLQFVPMSLNGMFLNGM